jgi:putative transposase
MARKQSSTKAKQIGQRRNSRRAPSKAKSREGLGASLRGQQQCLPFEAEEHVERRGGKRKGAGRKRQGPRDRVSHAKRPSFKPEWPLHVTLRLKEGLPTLRCEPNMEIFRQVMRECCELEGFRVTDWSVQSNHAHMIVEAESQEALTKSMASMMIRLAKRWNKLWGHKGRVFDDHYHAVSLDRPTRIRNALVYVLQNAKRHGVPFNGQLDPFSTAPAFEGWRNREPIVSDALYPRAKHKQWALRQGWQKARGGLLHTDETPKAEPKAKQRTGV